MELGLLYYGARFYVPSLGRFASADTIIPNPTNPQSYNRYSYVRNNPLNMTDPTGHRECNDPPACEDGGALTPPPPPAPQPLGTPLPNLYKAGNKGFAPDPTRPKDGNYHNGRDLKSDITTNLLAVATGHVRVADRCTDCGKSRSVGANYGVGNVVIIEYAYDVIPENIREAIGLESGDSVYVQYQHMATINNSITAGKMVQRYDIVGQYGNTGWSDGDHLHLEVHIGTAGALGIGNTDGTYDTYSEAWHDLSLVDPALIWNIPATAPPINSGPAPSLPNPFD